MFFPIPKSYSASTNNKAGLTLKGTKRIITHNIKRMMNILFEATRGKQLSDHVNSLALFINPGIVESYYVIVAQ